MKVAIVGAGVTGLVTAKVLLGRGHDVTIFEQRSALGGVWEQTRRYAGLKIQSPRQVYEYSDFRMPDGYSDYPAATQIASYLDAFANAFGLKARLKLNTRLAAMRKADRGWHLQFSTGGDGVALPPEQFDHVALCVGLFERPVVPQIEGRDSFEAAGGQVLHSSGFSDNAFASGKDVVVVGFGKSAIDVATEARKTAKHVTLVCRRTAWHVPTMLFGLLAAKDFSYSRSAEFWHGRRTGGVEGFVHRRLQWLVRLYWMISQSVIRAHLGLGPAHLRPPKPLRESVGLGTGFLFPDNLAALRRGDVAIAKGAIARLSSDGLTLADGRHLPAQLVVLATGYAQDLTMLSPPDRAQVVSPSGDYRLYRNIIPPHLQDLSFNGYNGVTAVPLTSEVAAQWLARWVEGRIAHPEPQAMDRVIDEELAWRRAHLGGNENFGHYTSPLPIRYLDTLLNDMGFEPADTKRPALARFRAMLDPSDYAFLNALP
jgi:dimethylaniline monooxygenase (N-oxide forming)